MFYLTVLSIYVHVRFSRNIKFLALGNGRVQSHGNSLNLNNNPSMSSSFNSGLNKYGINNSNGNSGPASMGTSLFTGGSGLGSGGSNNRSNSGSPQFNVSNLNSWNVRNGKDIPSWLSK